ncbi:MAG: hypothetical protein GWN71_31555, partial [Gammaproteobacteria bacterium]|nr:hypothetical protein [Gemmatimonadota bacterium]NIR34801.1 hypothetical protein [Actinomycetota bacterium]NIU77928.1 hypothetical protein [Gammaproteobacteria bacterium]NIX23558.1 hypothetical protein [Actinomycetota bacterium]
MTGEPEIATATAALAAAEAAVDAAFGAFHMSDPTAAAPHLARARADLASALDAMEPAPDAA